MSHSEQPFPDPPDPSAGALSVTGERPPALDATIARIEQGSREVQSCLDSIEQKIARLEPQLERLRQPPGAFPTQPETVPSFPREDSTEPAAVASPVSSLRSEPPARPEAAPRRRRSDRDDALPPLSDRWRPVRPTAPPPSQDPSHHSPAVLPHLLRPRVWAPATVLLLGGIVWFVLARGRAPSLPSSSASVTLAPTAINPGSSAAPRPSAGQPSPAPLRPSAATPLPGDDPLSPPASSSATDPTVVTSVSTGSEEPATPSSDLPSSSAVGVTPASPGKLHISSGVMAGNLIYSRQPEQPGKLARLFRVTGRVTMQVVISRSGRVANIHVLSGHHLLRGPAKDAVETWRYRPYLVNGAPVEVATIVSVDFHR